MNARLTPLFLVLSFSILHSTSYLLTAAEPAITPFTISVPDALLEDLDARLANTRWPAPAPGGADPAWRYGVDLDYMKKLVDYWREGYDWRAWEKKLNAHPQFTTGIDGLDIHFIHRRSSNEDATPLLLVHGWPGSVAEFHKIISLLTEPEKHGGKKEDAFHVVAPSLPGFGFSEAPVQPGWSVTRMAGAMAELMARLGYDSYGAQGGDWGAGVIRWLGTYDSEHVIGIHTNFPGGSPPSNVDDRWENVSKEERAAYENRRAELAAHKGYSSIQGTRPQTLGYALNDSPAGLAAWIVDKFWAWSDHRGDLDNSFTKDDLLTNIMLYWVTGTGPTSARIYFEREPWRGGRSSGSVPVGVARFPKEINVPPRAWIEARYGDNLVHFTDMPRGGHFAALETPNLLAEDIRTFFAALR